MSGSIGFHAWINPAVGHCIAHRKERADRSFVTELLTECADHLLTVGVGQGLKDLSGLNLSVRAGVVLECRSFDDSGCDLMFLLYLNINDWPVIVFSKIRVIVSLPESLADTLHLLDGT